MIVATVLRSGGCYDVSWVHALKRGLNRHLSDFEFRVLTDQYVPTWGVKLAHDWPGWWSKPELWRPGVFPEGELVLYVDLDTLPVGDLSFFEDYGGELAVLSDFYTPRKLATGVMLFRPGPHTEAIYEAFRADPEGIIAQHPRRSDHWYATVMGEPDRLQDLYPGKLVSFKKHARAGVPDGARLVCGHGQPRFSSPDAGWAHDQWARLSQEAA